MSTFREAHPRRAHYSPSVCYSMQRNIKYTLRRRTFYASSSLGRAADERSGHMCRHSPDDRLTSSYKQQRQVALLNPSIQSALIPRCRGSTTAAVGQTLGLHEQSRAVGKTNQDKAVRFEWSVQLIPGSVGPLLTLKKAFEEVATSLEGRRLPSVYVPHSPLSHHLLLVSTAEH